MTNFSYFTDRLVSFLWEAIVLSVIENRINAGWIDEEKVCAKRFINSCRELCLDALFLDLNGNLDSGLL